MLEEKDIKEAVEKTFKRVKELKKELKFDPSKGLIVHNPIEEIKCNEIPSEEKIQKMMNIIIRRMMEFEGNYNNMSPFDEITLREKMFLENMISLFYRDK